jgi:hypothetical protein
MVSLYHIYHLHEFWGMFSKRVFENIPQKFKSVVYYVTNLTVINFLKVSI